MSAKAPIRDPVSPSGLSDGVPKFQDDRLIREAVDRICQHRTFSSSLGLQAFLRFTVEHTLGGADSELKEYLIATEVFRRDASFDPAQTSIVRTQAVKLRSKLREYYESQGKNDPVVIVFRPGTYTPSFEIAAPLEHRNKQYVGRAETAMAVNQRPSIWLTPLPSTTAERTGSVAASQFAAQLTTELTLRQRLRVLSAHLPLSSDADFVISLTEDVSGPDFLINLGIVHSEGGHYAGIRQFRLDGNGQDIREVAHNAAAYAERMVLNELGLAMPVLGSKDSEAERLNLEGEYHLNRFTPEDCELALARYRAALDLDSANVTAWAGTALALTYGIILGTASFQRRKPEAKTAALHAVASDRWSSQAQTALGTVLALLEWRFADAERHLRQALDTDPTNPWAWNALTFGCWIPRGEIIQSIRQLTEILRIVPTHLPTRFTLGCALYFNHKFELAQAEFLRMKQFNGGLGHSAVGLTRLFLSSRDQLNEADAKLQEAEVHLGRVPVVLGLHGYISALRGEGHQVSLIRAELDQAISPGQSFNYDRALLALAERKPYEALMLLERSVRDREIGAIFLKVEPLLSSARKHLDMQVIMSRLG